MRSPRDTTVFVRFQGLGDLAPVPVATAVQAIHAAVSAAPRTLPPDEPPFHQPPGPRLVDDTPWWDAYLDAFFALFRPNQHEYLYHPLAGARGGQSCIFYYYFICRC